MSRPYVISINAVSGGGKTTLAKLVKESLPSAEVFCFDDFDSTNVYPEDFVDWYQRGGSLLEFDCAGMRSAVDEEILRGRVQYIVLDYPFGRDHPRFRDCIDLSVFVDTPFDIALARRILRDGLTSTDATPKEAIENLRRELVHYLEKGRPVYLTTNDHIPTADVVLDGTASLESLKDDIIVAIRRKARVSGGL